MTTTSLRDLAAYVSQFNYTTYYEKVILRNCPVVIDGCDLMQFLFLRGLEEAIVEVGAKDKNPKGSARKGVPNPHWFGGDWETYARNVRSFFQDLKKCEITPIVIMDGALSTIAAMKEEAELHEDPLDSLRLQGYPGKTYTPVFLKTVFLEVMVEQSITCFQTLMSSEYTIAFVSQQLESCFILSSKTDFLLFINNKTIRFQSLKFVKVASGDTVQEREKGKDADHKVGKANSRKVWTLQADYIFVHRLCDEEFQLKDRRLLPLAAVIVENEYIYNKAVVTFQALSTSRHQDDTPSNRIANLMKWLGRKRSLDEGITCLMRLLSEPKRLRSTWIINKIIKMYEGVNGELGVWFAIQNKLDTSAWTNTEELNLAFSRLPVNDTEAQGPAAKSDCPNDWLPFEPREMEEIDYAELKEACATTENKSHYLMEEKFRQHTDSLEFKACLETSPQWFINAHRTCEFQPYLLNLHKNFRMTFNPQVEWWEGDNCHEIALLIILATATILIDQDNDLTITGRGCVCPYTKQLSLLSPTAMEFVGGKLLTMYSNGRALNNEFKAELNKIVTVNSETAQNKVSKPKKLALIEIALFGSNLSIPIYVQSWPAAYRIWIACLLHYVRNNCGNDDFEMRAVVSVACSTFLCVIKNLLANPSELKSRASSSGQQGHEFYTLYQKAIFTQEQLTDCMGIVNVLECFLEQYCDRSHGSLYVFAFSTDLKATEKCLEWIFATAGRSIPVDVLNLSLYSHVASTQNNLGYRPVTREEIAVFGPSIRTRTCVKWGSDAESFIQSSGTKPSISPNRSVGKPLTGHFVYPVPLSLASYGVFKREDDVDFIVGCTYNYKYYKELCCIYHMLKGDGLQNCALNKSNRCAFTLLEILTMSNTVDTFSGTHYPTINDDNDPYDEQLRRRKMLSRWGITRMETDIVKRYVGSRSTDDEAATEAPTTLHKPSYASRS